MTELTRRPVEKRFCKATSWVKPDNDQGFRRSRAAGGEGEGFFEVAAGISEAAGVRVGRSPFRRAPTLGETAHSRCPAVPVDLAVRSLRTCTIVAQPAARARPGAPWNAGRTALRNSVDADRLHRSRRIGLFGDGRPARLSS